MVKTSYKIVHIIDTLEAGGAENVLITLCNLLQNHGHRVTVITTLQKGPIAHQLLPSIEVKELNRPSKWHLPSMRRLVQWCKPFDIVHVHSSHNLRYVFLAAKLFRLPQKICFHEHFGNIDIDQSVHWHQKLIYPKVYVISVSKSLERWAVQKLGLPQQQVFLLANTVAKQTVKPFPKNTTNTLQLICTGNFRPAKNIEFAIEVMAALVKLAPAHLTIVGQPNQPSYVQQIKDKIAALQLQAHITIEHNCHSVQQILPQFDIAMHTAKTESGPLVIIEYIAQQLPFLTFQTGEVVDQIQPLLPEMVLPHFNAAGWAQQILTIHSMNQTILQQRLQQAFDTYYAADAYYENCMNIYQNILQQD